MKKVLIGAMLAAAVSVPALALQQGAAPVAPQRGAPQAPAMTRAQVQAQVAQRFATVDANRDGAVTPAELTASRARLMQERSAQAFAMLDADKNGALSPQEFAARPGVAMRDGGGDRRGGRHGMRGHHGGGKDMAMRGGMGARWLERLDADSDGKVTLAEASARPLARFDRLDADKNGTVTPEERRAARAGWFSRRG